MSQIIRNWVIFYLKWLIHNGTTGLVQLKMLIILIVVVPLKILDRYLHIVLAET